MCLFNVLKYAGLLSERPHSVVPTFFYLDLQFPCQYCLCAAQFKFLMLVLVPGREFELVTLESSQGPIWSRQFAHCLAFVFTHYWSMPDRSQFCFLFFFQLLFSIFKLSSGDLLATFDFESYMMPHCFLLLLLVLCWVNSCQSDNNLIFFL